MKTVSESDVRDLLRDLSEAAPPFPALRTDTEPTTVARGRGRWIMAAAGVAVIGGLGPALLTWTTGDDDSRRSEKPGVAEPGSASPSPRPELASNDEVRAVAERLNLPDSPGYGKVAVDLKARQVRVFWNGTPPQAVTDSVGVQPNGVLVVLFKTRYSTADLDAAGAKVLTDGRRPGAVPVSYTSRTDNLSGIKVGIAAADMPQDLTELKQHLEEVAGVPVTIEEGGPVEPLTP